LALFGRRRRTDVRPVTKAVIRHQSGERRRERGERGEGEGRRETGKAGGLRRWLLA
jgi:hypothetical protein